MGKRTRYGCFEFPRLLPVAAPHGGIDAVRRDDAGLQDRREDVRLRGYERFRAGGREVRPRRGGPAARAVRGDRPGLPFQQKILERDKYARLPAR